MLKALSIVLVLALSAKCAVAENQPAECQRYLKGSTTFKNDIQKRGASAVISDWIGRIEADSVNRAWGCLLDAIGSADQGWLDVASLLWPSADGAAGEDLSWAFAAALDANPRTVLKHFKRHASQGLADTCGTETLPPESTMAELRRLLALRRERVTSIKDPDLKETVTECLRSIEEEEKSIPHDTP